MSFVVAGALAGCSESENETPDQDLGGQDGTETPRPPAASFDWNYDSAPSASANSLVITLQSVDSDLAAASLSIRGSLGDGESIDRTWAALSNHDQSAPVLAGDSVTLSEATLDGRPITDSWDLEFVWEPQETDRLFVLGSWAGPEA